MKGQWTTIVTLVLLLAGSIAITPAVRSQLPTLTIASSSCPAAGVAITSTAPTALVTTPGITTLGPRTVTVIGSAVVTVPTGTSGIALEVRRGNGTSGAQVVAAALVSATAQTNQLLGFQADDTPAEVAGQQYTLDVSPTGATGAGTARTCGLIVESH